MKGMQAQTHPVSNPPSIKPTQYQTHPVSNSTTTVGRSSAPVPIFRFSACEERPETIPAVSALRVPRAKE